MENYQKHFHFEFDTTLKWLIPEHFCWVIYSRQAVDSFSFWVCKNTFEAPINIHHQSVILWCSPDHSLMRSKSTWTWFICLHLLWKPIPIPSQPIPISHASNTAAFDDSKTLQKRAKLLHKTWHCAEIILGILDSILTGTRLIFYLSSITYPLLNIETV